MRTASRSPVTLKIKFKSTTLEQFIERYSVDISHGGIFIRTKDPLPVGTNLRFEFQLKDASPLITGDGTVVWTRDFDPTRSGVAPGMGVRFDRLPSESQEVLDQILAHKTAKLGKPPEAGFLEAPTKVAFGNIPTRVTPKELLEGLAQSEGKKNMLIGVSATTGKSEDQTPLPPALPYHNELDEFPDEAFEEATKVAALDALARRTAESAVLLREPRDEPAAEVAFGKSLDDDVTQERHRIGARPTARQDELEERDDEPVAAPPPPASVAPIFHDLPARSPFPAERAANGRSARESNDGPAPDHADPFSLPSERSGGNVASRAPRPLRIVATPAPEIIAPPAEAAKAGEGAGEVDKGAAPVEAPAEPPAAAPAKERESSNMPWIAAAAVLLLVGGVGGFWLLRGGKEAPRTAATAPAAETPPPATQPTPPAPEPAPAAATTGAATTAPAPVGLAVTVASKPDGAIAELVGGSQQGPTPMTFRGLSAGHNYQVKISKPGFLVAELMMKPEAGNPPAVELEAKPSVLHVTSEPPGAQIWINGRRQRSVTPADVQLQPRTVEKKRLTLSIRKNGFNNAEQPIELAGMVERGDTLVQEIAVTLVRRPVVRAPAPPAASAAEASAEKAAVTDSAEAGDKAEEKPAEGEAPVEGTEEKPSAGDGEAGKAAEPAKDPAADPAKPKPTEPAKPKQPTDPSGIKSGDSGTSLPPK